MFALSGLFLRAFLPQTAGEGAVETETVETQHLLTLESSFLSTPVAPLFMTLNDVKVTSQWRIVDINCRVADRHLTFVPGLQSKVEYCMHKKSRRTAAIRAERRDYQHTLQGLEAINDKAGQETNGDASGAVGPEEQRRTQ